MRERRPHRPIASATVSVAPTAPMVATTIGNLRGLRLPAEHLVRVGAARGAARTDANPELVPAAATARPRDRPTGHPSTMTMTRSSPPTRTPVLLGRSPSGQPGPSRARRLLAASRDATPVPRPIGDTPPTTSARKRAKRPDWLSRRRTKSCGPRSATRDRPHRWRHRTVPPQARVNGARRRARRVRTTPTRHRRRGRRSDDAGEGGIVRAPDRAAQGRRRAAVELRTRVGRTTDRGPRTGS